MFYRRILIICSSILIILICSKCNPNKGIAKVDKKKEALTDTIFYYKSLRLSYLLDVPVNYLISNELYKVVSDWLHIPYQPSSDIGIEDGKLVKVIYEQVYKHKIPSGYNELIYDKIFSLFTGKEFLEEGDLVFFEYPQIDKNKPEGQLELTKVVGIYLVNNHFLINCQRTNKVSIERIDDDFWSTYFKFAGRYKE